MKGLANLLHTIAFVGFIMVAFKAMIEAGTEPVVIILMAVYVILSLMPLVARALVPDRNYADKKDAQSGSVPVARTKTGLLRDGTRGGAGE